MALETPLKDFMTVFRKVHETGLVEVKTDGETHHALITNIHLNPLTRKPLHAELHAVSLTEKIKAHVPVVLTGESPAVTSGVGLLLQTLNEIEVEALPTELPENVSVDVSGLSEVDQQITVADLPKIKGAEVLTGSEEVVVKITALTKEEEAAPAPAPEGEAAPAGEAESSAQTPGAEPVTEGK